MHTFLESPHVKVDDRERVDLIEYDRRCSGKHTGILIGLVISFRHGGYHHSLRFLPA